MLSTSTSALPRPRIGENFSGEPYLLHDLLSCCVCGHRLQGRVQKSGRRIYVCVNGRDPDSPDTPEHDISIRAVEAEIKSWHTVCQLFMDPRRIADVWYALQARQQGNQSDDAFIAAELPFRPKQFRAEQFRLEQFKPEEQPALVELPLHEFESLRLMIFKRVTIYFIF